MTPIRLLCSALLVAFASTTAASPDPHSFANYDEVRTTHLELDLDVDFDERAVSGSITLDLEFADAAADRLILDSRDLDIQRVELRRAESWTEGSFVLGDAVNLMGQALTIPVDAAVEQVRIHYASAPGASGLQWLTPRQTAGKRHPFMFSQSQAIHARSWIPLQDTPAVRTTYRATVRVPEGLRAVMSANNDPDAAEDGEFVFDMPQPIPAYLLAIAVGDLDFKAISERAGVFAEREILDSAVDEFADTERMIQITEALYGEYRWGRYDLLILPPSFPFGGMENPRLSFITPTVIAGDRSLIALIAHELAHSWSGNLVTNASWGDLWLNEGFTSYVENRIMEELLGRERAIMEQALTMDGLHDAFKTYAPEEQVMARDAAGMDPDDVFTATAYSKGQLFLMDLEERLGRSWLDGFLNDYFDAHAFKSIDTAGFEAYFSAALATHPEGAAAYPEDRLHTWLHEPGIPVNAPQPKSDRFARVDAQRAAFLSGDIPAAAIVTAEWSAHEWLRFLNGLPATLSTDKLRSLDDAFSLTTSTNAEIAHAWYVKGIANNYDPVLDVVGDYLVRIGRIKLVAPLYQALLVHQPTTTVADAIYGLARPGYHPLTQMIVERDFKRRETLVAEAAARMILSAIERGDAIPQPTVTIPDFTLEDGFRTQKLVAQATATPHAGFKAALTSPTMQAQFGVHRALAGVLPAAALTSSDASIPWSEHLRAEAEIGFILNQDLATAPVTTAALKAAVDRIVVVAELPLIHLAGPPTAADLAAANATPYRYVVGETLAINDVGHFDLTLKRGDQVLTVAKSHAGLVDQWTILEELIKWALDQGYALRAGDLLLTGAMSGNVPVEPGLHQVLVDDEVALEFLISEQ